MRILYVEDHEDTSKALRRLLEFRGHDVTLAHTAREAIKACVEKTFDLWILDIGLPDGHGGTLLRTLRRMDDHAKAIAITGCGLPDEIAEGLDDGFDTYLVKPVRFEQLVQAAGA